ncbi:MAG: nucleotidyltransferase domain-containing protein [Myxococcaceae bacterium]|nr:nucleotidyltransferase domain-containing protein [Myxococcaceae bacterium]
MAPLPHGTEVLTRVERHSGERRLAPGTIGRVVRARDGGYDVHFVGVGEVWFAASELETRKSGQRAFAQRREAAWAALRPCIVLEAVVGSRAWGLAGEGSDLDTRGAFALPLSWSAGLVDPPTDLVSADGSHTFWELEKTVRQALRADPNTLELLFVPSVRATDELGTWLLEARDTFVSRAIFGSFGRYALSQLNKLEQAQRLSEHRDVVLDWLRAEALTFDACAERLTKLSGRDDAKTYLKQLYRSLSDQGLTASNDFEALRAYAREGGRRPPEARELRPKNAYNLLRLIALATGWLRDGAPTFAATGAFRERLLAIKSGAVPLAEVLAEAEAMTPALEAARDASRLPEAPDDERANVLVRRMRLELARRWVHQVEGPFGQHAAPPPSWEHPC